MSRCLIARILFVVVSATNAFAVLPSSVSSDGLELLKRVAQHYAEAKSYRIEFVEERAFHNDFQRNWSKKVILAAETSGNRYHYEAHSAMGTGLQVSDGTTVWTYRQEQQQYTKTPVAARVPSPSVITIPDISLMRAENARNDLAGLANQLKSAIRLPDATIVIKTDPIPCYVVRVQTTDMKRAQSGYSFEKTFWIAKADELIVRISEHSHTYITSATGRFPIEAANSTTYVITELNRLVPDTLFTFVPPLDAKLVDKFPSPMESREPNLTGEQAPPITFKSSDGKLITLASFRGKPLLIDVWATWCGPCVKGLADLARIYAEAKSKGLAVLTVDEDEEAKTAIEFLGKNGYSWANFHDDGDIEKQIGPSAIPRTILIDAGGKITYDRLSVTEEELRSAVAKIGPEYSSLAPKPRQAPCSATEVSRSDRR